MYDIKWICEQPRRVRPRADAARARAAVGRQLIGARREAPRGDHQGRAGAGAPQRGLEGDRRRPRAQEGRSARRSADGGSRGAQDGRSRAGSRAEEARRRARQRAGANSQHCRPTTCRTARTQSGNVEHHAFGKKRDYAFKPKQHFELGEALGLMDFETGGEIIRRALRGVAEGPGAHGTRARAVVSRCAYRREHGYTEVNPPLLVRDDVMFGTAQLPKFEDDQFSTYADRRSTRSEDCRALKISEADEANEYCDQDRPKLNRSVKIRE